MHDVELALADLPVETARALDAALRRYPYDDVAATGLVDLCRAAAAAHRQMHLVARRCHACLMGVAPGTAAAVRAGPEAVALEWSAHWLMWRAEKT